MSVYLWAQARLDTYSHMILGLGDAKVAAMDICSLRGESSKPERKKGLVVHCAKFYLFINFFPANLHFFQ